jgi:hypothetical protein
MVIAFACLALVTTASGTSTLECGPISTYSRANGFVQYGIDAFDHETSWIGGALTAHRSWLRGLQVPALYKVRTCAYDIHGEWSLTVSPYDTLRTYKTTTDAGGYVPANALYACYPNPFNPTTRIAFELPASARVSLAVFDASGRRVRVLTEGTASAGKHEVYWDGKDDAGRKVASGVYFYRLQSGSFTDTKKTVLLR